MKRDFNPVDVKLNIENPSIERYAFYSLCFITESNIAPRTLKVTRLQDLLDNGYSRLDLVYNFCVGVFSQQGMDTVYIRAKRSFESYVEAYNSDDNSMYYFVVLQTKDLTEVEKFNSHLVSSDEMKLQFFSQNVGSKIFQSPKIVNYYQDYTLSGGVPVESKDYYLNKAYSGVTVVSKIPLPDYLLGSYGNTAVDYGVRMMVGRDYIWEIDKPNRQVKYARSVVESGWVGSREESTINNSEVTVVATKGISGKLLRASIKDPKVKIETLSRELLKGLGKEVLDYAIPLIDPEAADWVLDLDNNAVKYTVSGSGSGDVCMSPDGCDSLSFPYVYRPISGSGYYTSNVEAGKAECQLLGHTYLKMYAPTRPMCRDSSDKTVYSNIEMIKNPFLGGGSSDEDIYIPIDTVSQQVIANADAGHLESKEFLKSIPLFAYLLTGSGTEAVNRAVLDIDAEATDWVLDPANNSVKYTIPAVGDGGLPVGSYPAGTVYVTNTACITASSSKAGSCELAGKFLDTVARPSEMVDDRCRVDGMGFYKVALNVDTCTVAPPVGGGADEEKSISIDTVAEKVLANAESGHTPSQEALRLSTVERVDIGEYDEALEAVSIEIDTSWKYLPIYDVAVQVKRNSIAGHAESIEAVNNSLPFELPNYKSNVTITGIAKVGDILTATVTDANGVPSSINYQWYADGEVILDATSETYVIKESDSGKTITVQADFTDKDGFSESVTDTVDVEVVDTGDMGLKADYSGTGWYKATDTGTVFNKGVPELETYVFSDSPVEYVSVYTKEDAKLYGERAAVSNITDMDSLFAGEGTFNEDLSSWDVSNVTSMEGMFQNATSFNFDMSLWDVSSVTDMNRMFYNATSFNQDLSSWCVTKIPTKPNVFDSFAGSWTLPRPVWGTCPSSSGGDSDTPWAYVPEETSVTGSTTTIKAKRTFENQRLKSSISVAASASKVGGYLIKGGGSDALDYAVVELIGEGIDWVMNPDNNSIKIQDGVDDTINSNPYSLWTATGIPNFYTADEAARATCARYGYAYESTNTSSRIAVCKSSSGTQNIAIKTVNNPDYDSNLGFVPAPKYKNIPLSDVAANVISNAISGDKKAQEITKAAAVEAVIAGEHDAALDAAAVIDN